MSKDYSFTAFKPGIALQASEINEFQDRFYKQQTFTVQSYNSWYRKVPDYSQITGYLSDPYISGIWDGAFPLLPNQINVSWQSNLVTIVLFSGWYNVKIKGLSTWIFVSSNRVFSFNPEIDAFYSIGVKITTKTINASEDPNDEGYELNDNSLGVISSMTDGASRIYVFIETIQAFLTESMSEEYQLLCKVHKSQSGQSFLIKIQYPNNYLIKSINI